MDAHDTGTTPAAERARELMLEAFTAMGAADGIAFVMAGETTGTRQLALLARLGCTVAELGDRYRSERWAEVIVPNRADAEDAVRRARGTWPELVVPNLVGLDIEEWRSSEYSVFKHMLLEHFAKLVVAGPDWAYSNNERRRLAAAVTQGLEVFDPEGTPVGLKALRADAAAADSAIAAHCESQGCGPGERAALTPEPLAVTGVGRL